MHDPPSSTNPIQRHVLLYFLYWIWLTAACKVNCPSGTWKLYSILRLSRMWGILWKDDHQLCLHRNRINIHRVVQVVPVFIFFFIYTRAELYCDGERSWVETLRVKNYDLFRTVTASIKLNVLAPHLPPKPAPRSALRAITEGQSEIEKSIWRRLAWMHLQAAVMTADSFLQLLAQSHSNLISVSKRAVLSRRRSSVKGAACLPGHSVTLS